MVDTAALPIGGSMDTAEVEGENAVPAATAGFTLRIQSGLHYPRLRRRSRRERDGIGIGSSLRRGRGREMQIGRREYKLRGTTNSQGKLASPPAGAGRGVGRPGMLFGGRKLSKVRSHLVLP